MSRYVSIRGWLEFVDDEQRNAADEVIERHRHKLYSAGWAYPLHTVNWTTYLFYGGDIRAYDLDRFENQLRQLATLPPGTSDHGFVDHVRGFFLVSVEDDAHPASWTIRDQTIVKVPMPDLAWIDT